MVMEKEQLKLRADLPFMDQLEELALAGNEQAEKELMDILSCQKCVKALSNLRFRPDAVQWPEEKQDG
jgi:hypothetical protein